MGKYRKSRKKGTLSKKGTGKVVKKVLIGAILNEVLIR